MPKLNHHHHLLLLLTLFLFPLHTQAQSERIHMTLKYVITLATKSSLEAFIAENMYLAQQLEFRNYQAKKRPFINLSITPFNFSRTVTQEFQNNSYQYINQQIFRSRANLSLSQNIIATGGRIIIDTDLARLGNLNSGLPTQYSSTLVRIGLRQPLFDFNTFKWESRIEPLKFEKAKRELVSSMENITVTAVSYFFDMAREQINLEIAENNVSNADSLYNIGQMRFGIAAISQEDVYTLQLEKINSRNELKSAKIRLKRAQTNLYSLLRLDTNVDVELIYPEDLPDINVDPMTSLKFAVENSPEMLGYRQQVLESEMAVEQTRKESRFNATLNASFGLNQTGNELSAAYVNPLNQQIAMLSINVSILDWGLARTRYHLARKNRKVTEAVIQQARMDFEHNILMTAEEFNIQESLVKGAAEADTVARIAYEIAMQRFRTGNVNVTQLNAVQQQTIDARRNYINALENYWWYYYTIRKLTLYDFMKNKTLMQDFEDRFGL